VIVCSKEEKKGTKRQKERRNNSECMANKVIRIYTMKKKGNKYGRTIKKDKKKSETERERETRC
jgi:hypothetical protein